MRRISVLLIAAAFLTGAAFHARDILAEGWMPYSFAPDPMNMFWTALLPLDLAVVALIAAKRLRAALALGLAIMVADVWVNAYALLGFGWEVFAPSLVMQSLFLGYLLGVAPFLWTAEGLR